MAEMQSADQFPPVRHGTSRTSSTSDQIKLCRSFLEAARGAAKPIEADSAIPAPILEVIDKAHAQATSTLFFQDEGGTSRNLVEFLIPIRWDDINVLKAQRPVGRKDIKSAALAALPGYIAETALDYANGNLHQVDNLKLLNHVAIWALQCFKDARKDTYNLQSQMDYPDERMRETTHWKVLGTHQNHAAAAYHTGALALHRLCEITREDSEVRERTGFILETCRYQQMIRGSGLPPFFEAYSAKLQAFALQERPRPFEDALYRINSPVRVAVTEAAPFSIDPETIDDDTFQKMALTMKPSPRTRRVVNAITKGVFKNGAPPPFFVMAPTLIEARYHSFLLNDAAAQYEKPGGEICSSATSSSKRGLMAAQLAEGQLSFISTTNIVNFPTDMFKDTPVVGFATTFHTRRPLTQYPGIVSFIEAGIPIRIFAACALDSGDTNRRNWIKNRRPQKKYVVIDSGDINSQEALQYFDQLTSDPDRVTDRPKQVYILMAIFQTFQGLKRKIMNEGGLGLADRVEFQKRIAKYIRYADRELKSEQGRKKFERDLSTVLARQFRSAIATLQYVDIDGNQSDQRKFGFLSRSVFDLTKYQGTVAGDIFARAAFTAFKTEYNATVSELPFSDPENSAADIYFGAEPVHSFVTRWLGKAETCLSA